MGEGTATDSVEVGKAAATAVTPDPVTADLLAKHSAGEKLTPSQYGKLGAWGSKLRGLFNGERGTHAGSPLPAPLPREPASVAPVAPAQAPDGGLAPVPIDAGLVQRTTNAVLTRCDNIPRRYVNNAAREAGATGETLARFDRAATLPKDDRALMVDLSPDVAALLGVNPRHYPLAVFVGTAGLWATDIWLAVQELKAMKEERKKAEATMATNEDGQRQSLPGGKSR